MMQGEKQGKLGDLEKLTLPQLQELLDRQEKLLSRQRFLQTLPDGGQKVKDFAVRLHNMIAERQKGCLTQTHTQSKGSLTQTHTQSKGSLTRAGAVLVADRQTTSCPERTIPSARDGDSPVPESNTEPLGSGEAMDSTAALSEAIDSLVISELTAPRMTDRSSDRRTDGGNLETRFPNSYEVIMSKNQTPGNQREPFKPSRSLKISDIHELPDAYKCKSRTSASATPSSAAVNQSAASSRKVDQSAAGSREVDQSADSSGMVDQSAKSVVTARKKGMMAPEDSTVPGPRYNFRGAKEISLQESFALQRQQKEQLEKLHTRQAQQRLAECRSVKTADYIPPALDMQYRSCGDDNDGDADDSDDHDEDDAPD